MPHHLYLLAHATEPRFKIGHSVDVESRASQLGGKAQFDRQRSRAYALASAKLAKRMERMLHEVVDAYRLTPAEVCREGRQGGDTEWFRIECMDKVIEFFDRNRNFIPWEKVGVEWESLEQEYVRRGGPRKVSSEDKAIFHEKVQEAIDGCIQGMREPFARLLALPTFTVLIPDDHFPETRHLIGLLSHGHKEEMRDLLDEIFMITLDVEHAGMLVFSRFFRHMKTVGYEKAGLAAFDVSVSWPGPNCAAGWTDERQCAALRSMTPGVEGWDLPLTVDGLAQGRQVQRTLVGESHIHQFYTPEIVIFDEPQKIKSACNKGIP